MSATAAGQLTVLADWKQAPPLARAQRDFLAITEDANRRALEEILEAVGEGRDSLLRLPLTNDELGAFARLADLVGTAWQDGSKLLAEKLLPRQVFAVTAADIFVPPPAQFLKQYKQRELRLAGVYEADRLRWVQNVVARSQVKGLSPAEMQATIGRRFPDWTSARLHNVARTETALLYEHGRVGRMQTSDFVQGYTFVAVIDGRTSDTCASRDGKVYTKEDAPVPPLHFQAICEGQLCETVEGSRLIEDVQVGDWVLTHLGRYRSVTAALGRYYDGDIHRIQTDGGEVCVTPEHPILTLRGWVAGEDIIPGDAIVSSYPADRFDSLALQLAAEQTAPSFSCPSHVSRNANGFKSFRLEELVAAVVCGTSRHVSTAINFDDQLAFGENEVSDILTYRHLELIILTAFKACTIQCILKTLFSRGWVVPICLRYGLGTSLCHAGHVRRIVLLHAFDSIRSFTAESRWRELLVAEVLGCLLVAKRDTVFHQNPGDKVSATAMLSGEPQHARVSIGLDDIAFGQLRHFINHSHHSPISNYTVVANKCQAYSGYVHDLSVAEDESYCIEGHVVHNCRSDLEPIFVGEEFAPGEPTQREIDSPPFQGFGGGPDIPIVQPAAEVPSVTKLPQKEWVKSLSDDEQQAFHVWSEAEADNIRKVSKTGTDGELAQSWERNIEQALDRAEPYEGGVWRGMKRLDESVYNSFLEAQDITLDSLQSATRYENVAVSFVKTADPGEKNLSVLLKIQNNKTGIDISELSAYEREGEVLLRRGARYRIVDRWEQELIIEGVNRKNVTLTLEEIL